MTAGEAYWKATVEDDATGQMRSIDAAFRSFASTVSGMLRPVTNLANAGLRMLADVVTTVTNVFTDLLPIVTMAAEAVGLFLTVGGSLETLLPILRAIGTALMGFATAHPIIAGIVVAITTLYVAGQVLQPIIYALGIVFDALAMAVNLCLAPFRLLWSAMTGLLSIATNLALALPRLLIGAFTAIGRAAYALQKQLLQTFVAVGSTLLSAGASLGSAVLTGIGRVLANPGKTLVMPLVNAVNWATEQITNRLQAVEAFLQSLGARIRNFGLGIAAIGALVVGPLTAAANQAAAFGAEIDRGARKAGMAATTFNELQYVAKRLGISVEELQAGLADEAGMAAFVAHVAEGKALGQIFDDDQINAARDLAYAYDRLKDGLKGIALQVGAIIAPAITDVTERSIALVKVVVTWIQNNRDLIATAFRIGSTIAAVGSAIAGVGTVVSGLGTVFGVLAGAVGFAGAGLAGLLSIVAAILSPLTLLYAVLTVSGVALVSWLNPIELARQGIAAIAPAVGEMRDRVAVAVQQAITVFLELRDWVGNVIGGINAAIRAGNLELAMVIAITGAKVALIRGLVEMQAITGVMFGGMFASLATGNFGGAFESLKRAIMLAIAESVQLALPYWFRLLSVVDAVITTARKGFNSFFYAMTDGIQQVGRTLITWLSAVGKWDPTGTAKKAALEIAEAMVNLKKKDLFSRSTNPQESAANRALDAAFAEREAARAAQLEKQLAANAEHIAALKKAQAAAADIEGSLANDRLETLRNQLAEAIRAAEEASAKVAIPDLVDMAKGADKTLKTEAASDKTYGSATFSASAAILMAGTKDTETRKIRENTQKQLEQDARHYAELLKMFDQKPFWVS